jgi:polyhydroxyalkanoate synthesis repressor PhaR
VSTPSTPESPAAEPRVVKRYSNRKLYDTVESRYVTLPQIADLVRKGEDVRIIDNNTKEDLTGVTLAQILYEEERKQSSALPLAALKDLINTSRERILSTLSPVTRLIARDGDGAVAEEPRPEEPAPDQPTPDAAETVAREPGRVQQFFEESRHAFEEWQHDADKRMKTFWEGINPAHQIQALQAEVKRLQARVDALEARLGAGESPAGGDRPAGEE